MTTPPASRGALLLALFATVLVHGSLVAVDAMPVMMSGEVARHTDPDSYTRLLRVLQLYEQGGWFDDRLYALAPPEGVSLHWTRPLDVLLLAVAWPASLFTEFRTALFAWGLVIAPLAHLVGVGLLWWGTRRFLSSATFVLLAVLLLMQRTVTWGVGAGRADHHLLHVVCALALLALLLRHAGNGPGGWKPLAAGAVAALALWSGSDGVVVLALGIAVLGAGWVVYGGDAARDLLAFTLAASAVLAVALAVERPPSQWLVAEFDRLSFVHVVVALAATGTAAVLAWLPPLPAGGTGRLARALVAVLLGVTVLVWLVLAFPGLAVHPYEQLPEVVHRQLLSKLTAENAWALQTPVDVFNLMLDFGAVPVAVGYTLLGPWRSASARPRLVLYAAALAVTLPYGVAVARGSLLMQLVAVIPVAEAVGRLAGAAGRDFAGGLRLRGTGFAGAALLAATWSPVSAAVVMQTWFPGATFSALPRCDYGEVLPVLASRAAGRRGASVLADIFDGPELAWRSGLPAAVGPYHRGAAGIRDYETILFSRPPDTAALAAVEHRDIGYFLFCRSVGPGMRQFFRANPDRLATRLFTQRPPPWLVEVPLPPEQRRRFVLYETRLPR